MLIFDSFFFFWPRRSKAQNVPLIVSEIRLIKWGRPHGFRIQVLSGPPVPLLINEGRFVISECFCLAKKNQESAINFHFFSTLYTTCSAAATNGHHKACYLGRTIGRPINLFIKSKPGACDAGVKIASCTLPLPAHRKYESNVSPRKRADMRYERVGAAEYRARNLAPTTGMLS